MSTAPHRDLDFSKVLSVEKLTIEHKLVPERCVSDLKNIIFSKLTDITDISKKTYYYGGAELPLEACGDVYITNTHLYSRASSRSTKITDAPHICCYTNNRIIKETLFINIQNILLAYGFKNIEHTFINDEIDNSMAALIIPYPTKNAICDMYNKSIDPENNNYKTHMHNEYSDHGIVMFGGGEIDMSGRVKGDDADY